MDNCFLPGKKRLCFRDLFGKKVKLNKNDNVEEKSEEVVNTDTVVINPEDLTTTEEPKNTSGVEVINPEDLKDPIVNLECNVEAEANNTEAHEVIIEDLDESAFLPINGFTVLEPKIIEIEETSENANVQDLY